MILQIIHHKINHNREMRLDVFYFLKIFIKLLLFNLRDFW